MRQFPSESLTEYKRRWDEETDTYVAAGGDLRTDAIQALMFLESLEAKPAVVQFRADLSNKVMEGTGAYPTTVNAMYNLLYQRKVVIQTPSKPGGGISGGEFSFITTAGTKAPNAQKNHQSKSAAGGGGGSCLVTQDEVPRTQYPRSSRPRKCSPCQEEMR